MKASPSLLTCWALCAAVLVVGTAPLRAQQKEVTDPLLLRARDAQVERKYPEALALYLEFEREHPAQTQDDVRPLLSAADCALLIGNKEQAFALCERAFQVPAKEGAHLPSPFFAPGPLDLRPETRWKMARIRRSQGRWSEALALYQSNYYPVMEGCVPTGWTAQEAAMNQGECLEHLGRFDEAVALYFPAAVNLGSDIFPEAMQRLFDMYREAGQLPDLERNLAREKATYENNNAPLLQLEEDPARARDAMTAQSSFSSYALIRQFKTAALAHNWPQFVAAFGRPTTENPVDSAVVKWTWREALTTLLALNASDRKQASQVLIEAAQHDDDAQAQNRNINLGAAIAALQRFKGSYETTPEEDALARTIVGYAQPGEEDARQFVPIPKGVRLPSQLPQVFFPRE